MLPEKPDVIAPDGSDVRVLAASGRGSMAHFTLAAGKVSRAVQHRAVEEIWFVLGGAGTMWLRLHSGEEMLDLKAGLSFVIPAGCAFQFRNDGPAPLQAVAITMPPWPGEDEAQPVEGRWPVVL